MSISELVPSKEAELALLQELYKNGGRRMRTGELVKKAIAHFPEKLTPAELKRKTPSGTNWWEGRFRYDLTNLKKKGEVINPTRDCWQITQAGINRLANSNSSHQPKVQLPDLDTEIIDSKKKILDWTTDVISSIKSGEVKAIVHASTGGFTVELGRHIKETQITIGNMTL